ncbi:MAG TPA: helix-turn-helix domain-containing protein, partial [Chryseosolibacter sp.]
RLKDFMDVQKPYLNASLSLPDLADKLHIPPYLLSRIVNERLNVNFFDFINQYRVAHVKTLLHDPKYNHLSLLGIALESGFNTKSAFNRVFKKITGQTPSDFKKAL